MLDTLLNILSGFRITDALDIAIVSYITYKILEFIRETRAQQLVRGIIVILAVFFVSDILDLYVLNFLLKNLFTIGVVAIVVLFQPELRRGLEQVGRKNLVANTFRNIDKSKAVETVDNIVEAVEDFSSSRTGALIAIERDTMLTDIIETGVPVDSEITVRMLGTIFYEGTPLHDGAVIIRGDRICAAACVLPLTENKNIGRNVGTRHKAGVGLSEVSDALIIIVSEETGIVSIAENGKIRRFVDGKTIEKILLNLYLPTEATVYERFVRAIRKKGGSSDGKDA